MVKFKFYTAISDNGDGSSSVHKFGTVEQAETYIEAYNADAVDIPMNDEDLCMEEIEFDDDGVMLNPDVYEKW